MKKIVMFALLLLLLTSIATANITKLEYKDKERVIEVRAETFEEGGTNYFPAEFILNTDQQTFDCQYKYNDEESYINIPEYNKSDYNRIENGDYVYTFSFNASETGTNRLYLKCNDGESYPEEIFSDITINYLFQYGSDDINKFFYDGFVSGIITVSSFIGVILFISILIYFRRWLP